MTISFTCLLLFVMLMFVLCLNIFHPILWRKLDNIMSNNINNKQNCKALVNWIFMILLNQNVIEIFFHKRMPFHFFRFLHYFKSSNQQWWNIAEGKTCFKILINKKSVKLTTSFIRHLYMWIVFHNDLKLYCLIELIEFSLIRLLLWKTASNLRHK